jgi:hypothetical protein
MVNNLCAEEILHEIIQSKPFKNRFIEWLQKHYLEIGNANNQLVIGSGGRHHPVTLSQWLIRCDCDDKSFTSYSLPK